MTDDGGNFQKGLLNYYFIAINQQPNETAVEEKPPTLGVFKATCSAIKCYIEFDSDRNGPQLTRTGLDLITHLLSTASAWPAKSCAIALHSSLVINIQMLEGIRIKASDPHCVRLSRTAYQVLLFPIRTTNGMLTYG